MSFKSFKSEFTEVYNYLSAACKDLYSYIDYNSTLSDYTITYLTADHSVSSAIEYKGDKVFNLIFPSSVNYITYRDYPGKYCSSDYSGMFGCFQDCTFLRRVVFSHGFKHLGINAFSGCSNLSTVILPNTLTKIDSSAFYCCCNLESIIIPASVVLIADTVFSGCSSLRSVTFNGTIDKDKFGLYVFKNCSALKTIYVPKSSYSHYCLLFSDRVSSYLDHSFDIVAK